MGSSSRPDNPTQPDFLSLGWVELVRFVGWPESVNNPTRSPLSHQFKSKLIPISKCTKKRKEKFQTPKEGKL